MDIPGNPTVQSEGSWKKVTEVKFSCGYARTCPRTIGTGFTDDRDASRTIRTGFTKRFVVSHATREVTKRCPVYSYWHLNSTWLVP